MVSAAVSWKFHHKAEGVDARVLCIDFKISLNMLALTAVLNIFKYHNEMRSMRMR